MILKGEFGPELLPEDRDRIPCCMGFAQKGAESCTCWEPVYDLQQVPVDAEAKPEVRKSKCHDCAYRPDSPESKDDPYQLLDLPRFFCHQGMRRIIEWRHPDGRVRPGAFGDYQPPTIGDVAFKANGRPAKLCAGWAEFAIQPTESLEMLVDSFKTFRVHEPENEYQLHEWVAEHLRKAGISFQQEVKLGPRCRIDFLVGDVGLEVKVGDLNRKSVVSQVRRYSETGKLSGIVLVSERILRALDLESFPIEVRQIGLRSQWGIAT